MKGCTPRQLLDISATRAMTTSCIFSNTTGTMTRATGPITGFQMRTYERGQRVVALSKEWRIPGWFLCLPSNPPPRLYERLGQWQWRIASGFSWNYKIYPGMEKALQPNSPSCLTPSPSLSLPPVICPSIDHDIASEYPEGELQIQHVEPLWTKPWRGSVGKKNLKREKAGSLGVVLSATGPRFSGPRA